MGNIIIETRQPIPHYVSREINNLGRGNHAIPPVVDGKKIIAGFRTREETIWKIEEYPEVEIEAVVHIDDYGQVHPITSQEEKKRRKELVKHKLAENVVLNCNESNSIEKPLTAEEKYRRNIDSIPNRRVGKALDSVLHVVAAAINIEDMSEDDLPVSPWHLVQFAHPIEKSSFTWSLKPIDNIDADLGKAIKRCVGSFAGRTKTNIVLHKLADVAFQSLGEQFETTFSDREKLLQLKSLGCVNS